MSLDRLLVLLLGVATAGCVSLTPPQQASLAQAHTLNDATTRASSLLRIYVLVGDGVAGVGGTYQRGMITISTPTRLSAHRDSLVAHELAHYVLGHDAPLTASSALDRSREQAQRELEANAKAECAPAVLDANAAPR